LQEVTESLLHGKGELVAREKAREMRGNHGDRMQLGWRR
jgi:hypothetical protein